jgi:methylase of polypeptide subunit release factors
MKSRLRVSSLDDLLFLHSAYPTDDPDSVFFGPDSYRFATLVRRELAHAPPAAGARLVDIGAGAGVGALVAGRLHPDVKLVLTDVNEKALDLARVNAASAGLAPAIVLCPLLDKAEGSFDLALANPPYIIDPDGRDYRDGGDMHGARIAYEMVAAALDRLAPAGRMILYTGSAIVDGEDVLLGALRDLVQSHDCSMRYEEIDPDVFGEELDKPEYREVERIAVVNAIIQKC